MREIKTICGSLRSPNAASCTTGSNDVVLLAVLGSFIEHHPTNAECLSRVVDVSDERNFLSGPFRRLGVQLYF